MLGMQNICEYIGPVSSLHSDISLRNVSDYISTQSSTRFVLYVPSIHKMTLIILSTVSLNRIFPQCFVWLVCLTHKFQLSTLSIWVIFCIFFRTTLFLKWSASTCRTTPDASRLCFNGNLIVQHSRLYRCIDNVWLSNNNLFVSIEIYPCLNSLLTFW